MKTRRRLKFPIRLEFYLPGVFLMGAVGAMLLMAAAYFLLHL